MNFTGRLSALVGGMLGGLLSVVLLGVVWDSTFESAPPGATTLASDLDTIIQAFKQETSNRAEVEIHWGTLTTTNDNGLMFEGSARCFAQDSEPTALANVGGYNGTSHVSTALTTTEPGGSEDQGVGRCWIDLDGPDGIDGTGDDNTFWVWDDASADFQRAVAAGPGGVNYGQGNLVYNGSFEVTDGTGDTSVGTDPSGWTSSGGTVAYTTPPSEATEGEGVTVSLTDDGGGAETLSQTLTSLKASTSYFVVARVDAGAASECRLSTSDAATNITSGDANATSTATTFTTVSGTFTTAAALDDVTIVLETNGAADVCTWDHVGVFEISPSGLPQPGYQVAFDTLSTETTAPTAFTSAPNPLLTGSVTIPGPGYVVKVTAFVAAADTGNGSECDIQLVEGGSTTRDLKAVQLQTGGARLDGTASLMWVDTAPTPGDTLLYEVEAQAATGTCLISPVNFTTTEQTESQLLVELIPAR